VLQKNDPDSHDVVFFSYRQMTEPMSVLLVRERFLSESTELLNVKLSY